MVAVIDTFELRYPGLTHAQVAAANPSSTRDTTPPSGATCSVTVDAYVNGSRWVCSCPDLACGGAERVSFLSGVMFCCECRNAANGNDYIQVAVPDADTREGIESALLVRPDWRTRNWQPGESIQDLLDENAAMGVS